MSGKLTIGRRTVLRYAGAGAVSAILAGCVGDEEPDPNEEEDEEAEDSDGASDEASDPDEEGITVVQDAIGTTLDPHAHREAVTTRTLSQTYEGLIRRDRDAEIIAVLATDYERVDDETVRFEIREDVEFHDGSELTPEDVAYSIRRMVDPDVGIASPQADQLSGVVGAEVTDDGAVDVLMDTVNPAVFSLFAAYMTVVSEEWVESRDPDEVATDMNGTGPYRIEEYEEDVELSLTRFEGYWDDEPAIPAVTFQGQPETSTRYSALAAGEADFITDLHPDDAPSVEDDPERRVDSSPATRIVYVAMRYDVEPFDSVEFRQAMNYAIDLEAIIESVLSGFGEPTSQPSMEGFFGFNPDLDPYPYDPDRAAELVSESGYTDVDIELHTPIGDVFGDVEVAQAAAGYIDELEGVSCEVQQREFGSLVDELLDGDIETSPEMYLISWGNATFETSAIAMPPLSSTGAITSFSDEGVDDLFAQAEAEPDLDEREELYFEINERLHELAPWVFLHQHYNIYGIDERIEWEPRIDEQIYVREMGLR
ncbi:ABC transporter substrate-binding protein [Natronorarus salvus]|uniref:ABC transporter substrate-binding protein n=1 Tax=Natronorarus salvus TaxID=3117733 RepID=UPI002F263699